MQRQSSTGGTGALTIAMNQYKAGTVQLFERRYCADGGIRCRRRLALRSAAVFGDR